MAIPLSGKASTPKKRAGKSSSESIEGSSLASLRFFYSESLHKKTITLLATLEQSPDPTEYSSDLAKIIEELTISGMNYYFMKPLQKARAGFIVQQSANLGMAGAQKVMGSVIRSIIGRMDAPQLLSVCGSIRHFML
jgi:hypothetical protein